ncbi:MAG: HAD hydrolase family protein [Planctomycetia bacterium]|nr:HAD hydrolase family protein [Planctomycetia bacterium]
MDLQKRASGIEMILSDVDGVLTDGRLIFDALGNEIKCFHAHDGLGIRIWMDKGYRFGFITRRCTEVVRRRAEELRIDEVFQGVSDKSTLLEEICHKYSIRPDQVAFIGDDLVDYKIMRLVGFAAAPHNAVEEIQKIAHLVTRQPGGQGAVREVIEFLLKSRGEWQNFPF